VIKSQTYQALHVISFPLNYFCLSIQNCASVSGKVGASFASVPLPIVAAIYCILFVFVGTYGWMILKIIQRQLRKIILQS